MHIYIKLNKAIFNNLFKKDKLETTVGNNKMKFSPLEYDFFHDWDFSGITFFIDEKDVKRNTFSAKCSNGSSFLLKIKDANEMRALIEREVRKHRYSYQEIINS